MSSKYLWQLDELTRINIIKILIADSNVFYELGEIFKNMKWIGAGTWLGLKNHSDESIELKKSRMRKLLNEAKIITIEQLVGSLCTINKFEYADLIMNETGTNSKSVGQVKDVHITGDLIVNGPQSILAPGQVMVATGPTSYEWKNILQNQPVQILDGTDDLAPNDTINSIICQICMVNIVKVMPTHCNHLAYCIECYKKLKECAICKGPVNEFTKVHLP